MNKASLAASDVSSATCTLKDGKYTVTLKLKDGSSSASSSGKSDSSPLKKSGIFNGSGDNGDYDYKSAANIYDAINGIDVASAESVNISTSGATVTAVINASNSRLEKLTVEFDFSATMKNVKYSVATIREGKGDAETKVVFSSFKY